VVDRPVPAEGPGLSRLPVAPILRREWVQLLLALVVGGVSAATLLGGVRTTGVWRVIVLPVALLLVLRGLKELVSLARTEWQRGRPAPRAYASVILRFLVAYLIVAVASS